MGSVGAQAAALFLQQDAAVPCAVLRIFLRVVEQQLVGEVAGVDHQGELVGK